MSTLTVTSKGQIILQKDLLDHLGIGPGEKIVVEKLPNGRIEMKASRPVGNISDVFGLLRDKRKGRALSIEQINTVSAQAWAGKRRHK